MDIKMNKRPIGMPSLTLEGRRAIIAMALNRIGEKPLLAWLKTQNIPSLRHLNENVRSYKKKFFIELFDQ